MPNEEEARWMRNAESPIPPYVKRDDILHAFKTQAPWVIADEFDPMEFNFKPIKAEETGQKRDDLDIGESSLCHFWLVGPINPSDQSNAIVAGFLYMFLYLSLSLYFCLMVGFRPRFHSGYLAPSGLSCLKRQTTLR